jgi:prephenate dehydrogenase
VPGAPSADPDVAVEPMRIAVLGTGLIGGSVALAARERLQASVAGWDPAEEALAAAVQRGAVDAACRTVADAVAGAEVVFCAAPVAALAQLVSDALAGAGPDCVVTDVGSTKRGIVAAHRDVRFVGGHPLAGAETGGVAHARADLFEGAAWYLTPTPDTDGILYERLHRVLTGIGARPAAIDAETHDQVLAVVSHLPHVLANVLVSQAAATLARAGERMPATGPSFRDATRVAGAPSAIWTDIYLANRDALIVELDGALARLADVRAALAAGDPAAITTWNDGAADDRHALLGHQLTGGALHELRVSVPNRPGVIAELALALGRAGVNITDMTLSPSADMRDGVVALGVAGDDAAGRARELIAGLGHPVQQL